MNRLMVITTPDLAPGFQLAGVETFAVENAENAEAVLRELLVRDEASLIVVRQDLLQAMPHRLQRQLEASYRPLVMAIPGGTPTGPTEERRHYIAELIRRAIGFQITFGAERPPAESSSRT
jgi:V/A-type H+-transporting ATPase subunit F